MTRSLSAAISGIDAAQAMLDNIGNNTANVIWLPIEGKLHRIGELEVKGKQLVLDGILAIQGGLAPRIVEQQLLTYLAPKEREAIEAAKAAKKKAA